MKQKWKVLYHFKVCYKEIQPHTIRNAPSWYAGCWSRLHFVQQNLFYFVFELHRKSWIRLYRKVPFILTKYISINLKCTQIVSSQVLRSSQANLVQAPQSTFFICPQGFSYMWPDQKVILHEKLFHQTSESVKKKKKNLRALNLRAHDKFKIYLGKQKHLGSIAVRNGMSLYSSV